MKGLLHVDIEDFYPEEIGLVALDELVVLRVLLIGVVAGYVIEDNGQAYVEGGVDDVALGSVGGRADPEVLHRGTLEVPWAVVKQLLTRRS